MLNTKPSHIHRGRILIYLQGSHRSGKSGEILKKNSSQGNQGKMGFSAKIMKTISNQGTFSTVGR